MSGNTMEKIIADERETRAFGLHLAASLRAGDVVCLVGDLGVGKTALTKYIALGLGVQEEITSPTFTIIRQYDSGRLPLYHFDVYRLTDELDMDELGYEEFFYGKGVTVVEWADKISGILPPWCITIHIAYGRQEEERVYQISGLEERINVHFDN